MFVSEKRHHCSSICNLIQLSRAMIELPLALKHQTTRDVRGQLWGGEAINHGVIVRKAINPALEQCFSSISRTRIRPHIRLPLVLTPIKLIKYVAYLLSVLDTSAYPELQ